MLSIILVVLLTHIVIYFSYPDTTMFGLGYLFASNLVWIGFFMTVNIAIRNLSKDLKSVIKFIIYFIMLYITMNYYPQIDRKSVFDKIANGIYPDKYSILRGLKRFGI